MTLNIVPSAFGVPITADQTAHMSYGNGTSIISGITFTSQSFGEVKPGRKLLFFSLGDGGSGTIVIAGITASLINTVYGVWSAWVVSEDSSASGSIAFTNSSKFFAGILYAVYDFYGVSPVIDTYSGAAPVSTSISLPWGSVVVGFTQRTTTSSTGVVYPTWTGLDTDVSSSIQTNSPSVTYSNYGTAHRDFTDGPSGHSVSSSFASMTLFSFSN